MLCTRWQQRVARSVLMTVGLAWLAACASNQPPGKPEVDIEPPMPDTTDDLRLLIMEHAEDPDGDPLRYATRWYHEGALAPEVKGDTVPSERTTAGEYWIGEIWASDGELEGPVADATIYVFNTAPEAEVRIAPSEPLTRFDLVAVASATDLDGHEVEFGYSWSVDGVATDHQSDTVPASETGKGELWSVEVVPFDGDSWGTPQHAEVEIGNTAPGSPSVAIEPEQPNGSLDDLRCVIEEPAPDQDDDLLDYVMTWRVQGAPFEDTETTENEGDTVPSTATLPLQLWECTVVASDGESEGRPARVSVTTSR